MYKVLLDQKTFCDSRVDDLAIINPVISLAMNSAGSFIFTIPADHPRYNDIQRRKSIFSVYRDDESNPIFQGIVTEEKVDIYKQKTISCEGELSYFNDSILRPAKYEAVTPLYLLTTYINEHNAQVDEYKRFEVGNVTVSGNIYCYTNMNSTMTEIKEDLIDDFGGYMRVRYDSGKKYIDYLADAPRTASQTIELGKNLIDYKSNIDDIDLATRIIPLGAIQEEQTITGLDTRLTISSVNNNKDYLQSDAAVQNFGYITKTIEFDDITTPSALKSKGQVYLNNVQFEKVVIEVSAIDFGYLSDDFEKFRIMDYVHIISEVHGMDKWFILTQMTLNLNKPEDDRFVFGKSEQLSLSAKTSSITSELTKALANVPSADFIQQAIASATAIITGTNGGYVRFNYDEHNNPYEILIMNTDSIDTASKVWRWNQNGFGYSSHGYNGPYETAITMDGAIVCDALKGGTIRGQSIQGGTITGASITSRNDEVDESGISIGDGKYISIKDGVISGGIDDTEYGSIKFEQKIKDYDQKEYTNVLQTRSSGYALETDKMYVKKDGDEYYNIGVDENYEFLVMDENSLPTLTEAISDLTFDSYFLDVGGTTVEVLTAAHWTTKEVIQSLDVTSKGFKFVNGIHVDSQASSNSTSIGGGSSSNQNAGGGTGGGSGGGSGEEITEIIP